MSRTFIIGSRGSKLALWQAEWAKSRFEAAGARAAIEIIKTTGDVQSDAPLSEIGGQGAFTKEIERALLDGRVDAAVHSLKDLPTLIPDGLSLTAVTEREDVRDALVLPKASVGGFKYEGQTSLRSLPEGSTVGTSSARRISQLKSARPDLVVKAVRGNVDTRLRKLDAGEFDAIILACAGLRRLGLEARISSPLAIEEMLPAVGQGALAIETREDDAEAARIVKTLDHAETRAACFAERALLRALGGGCQLPIAAFARVEGARLRLDGLAAAVSGASVIRDSIEGDAADAEALGESLAHKLEERGALSLLDEHANS